MPAKLALLTSVVLTAALSACLSHRVDVVPFLTPTEFSTLDALVERINRWQQIHTLVLRVDIQFETVEGAAEGRGRQYRTAQGRLLLERPNRIRLNIEAPILSANIAEMASNGEHFQLLIHPTDYRALIIGTNGARYDAEAERLDRDPKLAKAGPLVNIRPQHFTDAFLLTTISPDDPYQAALLQEERVAEPDVRPGAKKNAQVLKSYYVVTAFRLGAKAPKVRYWFDRVRSLELTRQQVFDADGLLVSDVRYSGYFAADADTGVRLPSRVRIERPYDDYTFSVRVRPDGVMLNRELPDTAFEVVAPAEWGESLRHIDLDERAKGAGQRLPIRTLR